MLFSKIEKNLESLTGLSILQIRNYSPEKFKAFLENKTKTPLSFTSEFPVIGRGNVLRDSLVGSKTLDSEIDKILR